MSFSSVRFSFFFFSSRRRHTRYWRDWSSDVCSSDLGEGLVRHPDQRPAGVLPAHRGHLPLRRLVHRQPVGGDVGVHVEVRSEERREGKSVDLGGRRIIKKKKREYVLRGRNCQHITRG